MSGLPGRLANVAAYWWSGPAGLSRPLQLEWRLMAVRWLGILLWGACLQIANLPLDRILAGYGLVTVASIYNLGIQQAILRRPGILVSGYVTTLGDSLLCVALALIGGGFSSQFYYVFFAVTISASMRFGYGPALLMASIVMAFDAVEQVLRPGAYLDAAFVFRSGFLYLTALLAGYLRDQAQHAESALEERLRQAHLLNDATATLGASLELDQLLQAVFVAAARLFQCDSAVLFPSRGGDDGTEALQVTRFPVDRASSRHDELADACARQQAADAAAEGGAGHPSHRYTTLPSGRPAIVLRLPSRQVAPIYLALAGPPGQPMPRLDADIVDSFVERVTLAIENAALYRTLARQSNDLQRAYADLAIAHQELLSVDEMKTNFLANVSHEFRTPLSSIRAFSELLLDYDDPAVRYEFLHVINSESERLTRLVEDVLDITKIESGHMDWHMVMVDMAELIEEAARMCAPLVAKHALTLRTQVDAHLPPVRGDRDRLQQVIANLVGNAVKFTPEGTILLRATQADSEIHVSVSDTGIGIAPEDQERIFDKFQQIGAVLTNKPRGTGLGLAISREIIAHHGGRIWVESQPGHGSTFTFSLAIEPSPATVDLPTGALAGGPVSAGAGAEATS